VYAVGYLHSLTFPARRVRLHPEKGCDVCTRCGGRAAWGVRTMIFEMGEGRPKESEIWRDPFAAYSRKGEEKPIPVRPAAGRATWREYGTLFLKNQAGSGQAKTFLRPALLDQMVYLTGNGIIPASKKLVFRCIGMRTDMKAKIFEWVDSGFEVPLKLLESDTAGRYVDEALRFARECDSALSKALQSHLNRTEKGKRYAGLKILLKDRLWERLAEPFRWFTLHLAEITAGEEEEEKIESQKELLKWMERVVKEALAVLDYVLDQTGEDGRTLHLRYATINDGRQKLYGRLKKERENYERK
jgi:CRISPR system Cascade subunit CasA